MGVSSTSNEWPQIEERMAVMPGENRMGGYGNRQGLSATTATTRTAIEGANSIPAAGRVVTGTALAQQPLKCPRCESSNTKFCYYNNYSLTQPRHFCKACKRYWTRGGTLRNVPVGGGCRKNKRVRRSSSSSSITAAATTSTATARVSDPTLFPNLVSALSLPPSYSSCAIDPIFYGLHGNSNGIDFPVPYPSFLKKLDHSAANNYDLINPNLNSNSNLNLTSMGLCFPINAALATHQDYMPTPPNNLQFHQTDSTSLFHDFSFLGTSSFTSSAAAASLIATKMSLNSTGWSANPSLDGRNIQAPVSSAAADLSRFDGVKEEDRNNGGVDWQIPCVDSDLFQNINAVEGNSLYWNVNPPPGIANGWPEPPAANHSVT